MLVPRLLVISVFCIYIDTVLSCYGLAKEGCTPWGYSPPEDVGGVVLIVVARENYADFADTTRKMN